MVNQRDGHWFEYKSPQNTKEYVQYMSLCEKFFKMEPNDKIRSGYINNMIADENMTIDNKINLFRNLIVFQQQLYTCMCGRDCYAESMRCVQCVPCSYNRNILVCEPCFQKIRQL